MKEQDMVDAICPNWWIVRYTTDLGLNSYRKAFITSDLISLMKANNLKKATG